MSYICIMYKAWICRIDLRPLMIYYKRKKLQ